MILSVCGVWERSTADPFGRRGRWILNHQPVTIDPFAGGGGGGAVVAGFQIFTMILTCCKSNLVQLNFVHTKFSCGTLNAACSYTSGGMVRMNPHSAQPRSTCSLPAPSPHTTHLFSFPTCTMATHSCWILLDIGLLVLSWPIVLPCLISPGLLFHHSILSLAFLLCPLLLPIFVVLVLAQYDLLYCHLKLAHIPAIFKPTEEFA